MYIYRVCLIGTLMTLAACSGMPTQHSAQPVAKQPAMPVAATTAVVVPAAMPAISAPLPVASVPAPAPAEPMAMTEPAAAPVAAPIQQPTPPPPVVHHVIRHPPLTKPTSVASVPPVAASARVQLSGHVELTAARGQQVDPGERVDTLVYFVPKDSAQRARPGSYTIYTHNRDFNPDAVAVPLGSTVTFVNLDDVRHNVFSVTPGSSFNLGYQGTGQKAAHVFTHAGLVLVSCNVHHSMELDMLVVPSAYMAKVSANGNFTLTGLPAGAGTLHFWNPRALPASQPVTVPLSGSVKQTLQAIKPRMTTELNLGAAR